jgi:hypothetical protein
MVRARISHLRLFSSLVGDAVLAIGLAVLGEAQLWSSGDLSLTAATDRVQAVVLAYETGLVDTWEGREPDSGTP